jgi:hypothetical protein
MLVQEQLLSQLCFTPFGGTNTGSDTPVGGKEGGQGGNAVPVPTTLVRSGKTAGTQCVQGGTDNLTLLFLLLSRIFLTALFFLLHNVSY